MTILQGIFPALITPFDENGEINCEVLKNMIDWNMNKGVNGFYVGGSSSEAFMMNTEERKKILKLVTEETKNKEVDIIYHIGSLNIKEAIELGKYAKKLDVTAMSSVSPFYYNFSLHEIKEYYYHLMRKIELPMIVYNFPAGAGVKLNLQTANDLFSCSQVVGIKHTSSDLYQIERFKNLDENMVVFNGYDEAFLGGLAMGADGGIGSTFNFMAEKFIKIQELFKEGKILAAQQVQTEANEIIEAVVSVGVIPGVKYILQKKFSCGFARKPFKKLGKEEKAKVDRALERTCLWR